MDKEKTTAPPYLITSVWPALLLLTCGVGMLVWSRQYAPVAARFPSIVAAVMIALGVLDVLGRTGLPMARLIRTAGGAGFSRREMSHDPSGRSQWALVLWISGAFAGMAVAGIMPASLLFCILFAHFRGNRGWGEAILVGAVVLAFQFLVFEYLLDYELYRGLFLAKGGVRAW